MHTSCGYGNACKTDRPMPKNRRFRPDQDGGHKAAYEKHRRIILAQQEVCALCGLPVDKSLKFPHPMSATVDHIIPVAKGGHPSALENLQLAHLVCNQVKSSKLTQENNKDIVKNDEVVSNNDLPLSYHWESYRSKGA